MLLIPCYLKSNEIPSNEGEEIRIRKHVSEYTILSRNLYQMGHGPPMIKCLGEHETVMVLNKVHKGVCSSHIGGKALSHKLLKEMYHWPTLMKDNITIVKKCD